MRLRYTQVCGQIEWARSALCVVLLYLLADDDDADGFFGRAVHVFDTGPWEREPYFGRDEDRAKEARRGERAHKKRNVKSNSILEIQEEWWNIKCMVHIRAQCRVVCTHKRKSVAGGEARRECNYCGQDRFAMRGRGVVIGIWVARLVYMFFFRYNILHYHAHCCGEWNPWNLRANKCVCWWYGYIFGPDEFCDLY